MSFNDHNPKAYEVFTTSSTGLSVELLVDGVAHLFEREASLNRGLLTKYLVPAVAWRTAHGLLEWRSAILGWLHVLV
ncbi:MAG: hypothetical protein DRJ62_07125 [Thermoprotei archaeon]|nr:MAG: hypothetical protein DRJ62_07125 [Thermoprotei archaeon]